MKVSRFKTLVIALACLNACVGGIARGAEPNSMKPVMTASPRPLAADVSLSNRRSLDGQVVDASGAPVAGAPVSALQNGRLVASVYTDEQGWFSLTGLKGGVYQLESENGASLVRAWTNESAPPAARDYALVVDSGEVARGQGVVRRLITNPWVWGIGIATAVAVPVIIATSDDDEAEVPNGS
jgi:hypothetical protein